MINTSIKAYADKGFCPYKNIEWMKKGLLSSFLSALNTDDTFLPSAESHDCQVSIPTGDSHILEDYCFLHLMAIK